MRRQTVGAFLSINGERISVPGFPHLRCPRCGEAVLSVAEARELQRQAIERYRLKYGLLSADEIRAIRRRHDLTQGEFARLLRLGGNTVSRWESGRNVQSAAMDVLLRLIRDLPESLRYLREHAA
jgi:putative zinc finger/helix-turn-helix YgiT family protein